LLPALVIYTLFTILPIVEGAAISLFDWDGVSHMTWVGLANYADLIADPSFQAAVSHALIFIAFYALLPVALGLIFTAAMTRFRLRGLVVFRTALFLPYTLASVVVAICWRWVLAPDASLSTFMTTIGLGGLTRPWLGDFFWAIFAIGAAATWVWMGFTMVLFIAGQQRIPAELYDAARADGAGPVAEFFAVTLPGLRYEITVALLLTVIVALRNFELVLVMTRGGPGDSTTSLTLLLYQAAFQTGQVGVGAAYGVLITVLILVAAFIIQRIMERE
jgi:raffinose/stachyose/melibiose transport system permease protein